MAQSKETPPWALHQTHHHYYLNISVKAANLSDWRIESNRNFFCPNWNALAYTPIRQTSLTRA